MVPLRAGAVDPQDLRPLEAALFQVLRVLEDRHHSVPVVVALGSNLGPKESLFRSALAQLRVLLGPLEVGPWLTTDPWGPVPQAPYLNTVALGFTLRSPWDLLYRLKTLERRAGRAGGQRWGPRTLDLDLVFYGRLRIHTPSLVLPHPRYQERDFVIHPLLRVLERLGFRL